MKLLTILFFMVISLSLGAQDEYSRIKTDNHREIDYDLNREGDSIWIKHADTIRIYKVRIIHSFTQDYWDFKEQDSLGVFHIPLEDIPVGNCTVVAYDARGWLNTFTLVRLKEIREEENKIDMIVESIESESTEGHILRYEYIEIVDAGFGSNTKRGYCDFKTAIDKIKKNKVDLKSKNGRKNRLEIYAHEKDNTKSHWVYKTRE